MNFQVKLSTGAQLLLEQNGEHTRIQLKSDDSSSHQSQSSSFTTGKWSQQPKLFQSSDGAILQIEAGENPVFFALAKNGIRQLDAAPNLEQASSLSLEETDESLATSEMKPMAPMKPMKPFF